VEELALSGLDADEARALARALGGDAIGRERLASLVERGSGLPLYLEELMREAANSPGDGASVPAGLLVSLAARLDGLGPARKLAQIASVIGSEAPVVLLAAISGRPESQVLDQANTIVSAGLGGWVHGSQGPAIHFAHALMADAAYDSLPNDRRRKLHEAVAQRLEGSEGRRHPERIARHFERAANHARAMDLWRRAARHAVRSYALDEAGAHLERAIACLERIRGEVDPTAEMNLRLVQIDYLNMRHGFTGAEQRDAFARVTELVDDDALDDMNRFVGLLKLTTQTAAVSRMEESNRWADRAESLARRSESPMLTGFLGAPAGTARLLNGRYLEAREITEKAVQALGVGTPTRLDARLAEPWVMTLCILAHAHAALGWTGEARSRLDAAVEGARSVDPADPHTLGHAFYFRAMLLLMEGEIEAGCRDAREMIALGDRHGFAELAASGRMIEACRRILVDDPAAGVAAFETQQALVPAYKPFAYVNQILIEGMARAGDPGAALDRAVAHHRELVARGELHCSEEFHALIGELRVRQGASLAAGRSECEQGLESAVERSAHGPRLRIAIRLARLLDDADRADEAARVLRDALGDYPDPRGSRRHDEASALLADVLHRRTGTDELRPPPRDREKP